MPVYQDEVVVLRSLPLGESDRILTLFGRRRGLVRAAAKGVRKTSSRFGGRLEPGSLLDVQLFTRNPADRSRLETLTQAVLVHSYGAALTEDYTAFATALACAEVAERLIDAEPAPDQWLLLVAALRDLAARTRSPELILARYLLRVMTLAGWAPRFTDCVRCGAPGPHARVSLAAGGAVCEACAATVGATIAASVDTMRLLWALVAGHDATLDTADEATVSRATAIAVAYASLHLGGGLRALDGLEQVRRDSAGTLAT